MSIPRLWFRSRTASFAAWAIASGWGTICAPGRFARATTQQDQRVPAKNVPEAAGATAARTFSILYTGSTFGVLEPCGCTSDPLGDVARLAGVAGGLRQAGRGVMLVDAGNLSYPANGVPARKREAAKLRARFLTTTLEGLGLSGAALGETDVGADLGPVTPKRLAANLGAAAGLEPSRLVNVGGVKIGVLGLADPSLAAAFKTHASNPVDAAVREAQALRARGAEIVVALVALDRPAARKIARAAPIDFTVVGASVGEGQARAEAVGAGFLLVPAEEMQKVGRVDVTLRGRNDKLVDAGGEDARALRGADLDARLATLDETLARWRRDVAGTDPSFVAQKQKERQALADERTHLASTPWTPPVTGSYFTNTLVPLRRALPRDARVAAAMHKLDVAIGAINLRQAEPPPRAEPGRAAYVGDRACTGCHKTETAFWKTTVHAQAWRTLVDVGKQADLECVGCHVTGYGEVGGSALGFTKGLENVQCETCHGPGSLHVKAEGLDEPSTVHAQTPEDTCLRCHTSKHSDTFNYAAYLRDILGTGHGAKARAALGEGPTGHGLRSAALAKARDATTAP